LDADGTSIVSSASRSDIVLPVGIAAIVAPST
jgi:hypothetical protein